MNRVPFFSIVSQENDLFRGLTLQENIEYGALTLPLTASESGHLPEDLTLHALQSAIEDAQLTSVLRKLNHGLQSAVGPRGRLLSGGERQRVCIARALYRQSLARSSILLLDEVTSSLDMITERTIMENIYHRVREEKLTVLMIAHRLASVQECDQIIVMESGRVIAEGTHQELLAWNDGRNWYAESWRLQFAESHNVFNATFE